MGWGFRGLGEGFANPPAKQLKKASRTPTVFSMGLLRFGDSPPLEIDAPRRWAPYPPSCYLRQTTKVECEKEEGETLPRQQATPPHHARKKKRCMEQEEEEGRPFKSHFTLVVAAAAKGSERKESQ